MVMVPPDELRKKRNGTTTPPLLKRAGTTEGVKTRNEEILQLRQEQIMQAEANRSLTSRFLEELGYTSKALGQGVARGFASTIGAGVSLPMSLYESLKQGKPTFIQPKFDVSQPKIKWEPGQKFAQAIFGEKPFTPQSEAQETAEFVAQLFGTAEEKAKEKAKEVSLPLAFVLAGIDIATFGGGKGFLKGIAKRTAKMSSSYDVLNLLKKELRVSDREGASLASELAKTTDVKKSEEILTRFAQSRTQAATLRTQTGATEAARIKALWRDKQGRVIAQIPVEDFVKNNLTGIGRQRTINKSLLEGIHAREMRKLREMELRMPEALGRKPGIAADLTARATEVARGASPRSAGYSAAAVRNEIKAFAREVRATTKQLVKELKGARRVAGQEARRATKEALVLPKAQLRIQQQAIRKELGRGRRLIQISEKRAADIEAKLTRARIGAYQDKVVEYLRRNLPVALRGKYITDIKNATTARSLERALDRVEVAAKKYQEARKLAKELRTRRSKLAFIQKIGELNSTALKDMKQKLGITKAVGKMDTAELDAMIAEALKRFRLKKELGLVEFKKVVDGKIVDVPRQPLPTVLTEEQMAANRIAMEQSKRMGARARRFLTNIIGELKKPGDIFNLVSEELRRAGAEEVLTRLRKMGQIARNNTYRGIEVIERMRDKLGMVPLKKQIISDADWYNLDLAMKNGAIDTVMQIAKKYGIEDEIRELRVLFDDVMERAKGVGLEGDYRKNFFPRSFRGEDEAARQALEKFLGKDPNNPIAEALSNYVKRVGTAPDEATKWKIINNLMRGFKQEGVYLMQPKGLKARSFEQIPPELSPFYDDSFTAMTHYFESVNSMIEARKFFGKSLVSDIKKLPSDIDFEKSIGQLTDELVLKGEINPLKVDRVREVLTARFKISQMNWKLRLYKDVAYATIMGDPISAVTQFGDLEKVFYRAGTRRALPAIFKAIFMPNKGGVSMFDLHLKRTISEEMSNPTSAGKMVNTIFKSSGLTQIDMLGKNSFTRGTLERYIDAIKAGDEEFLQKARRILKDEANETFAAMLRGEATENVRFLMLNELEDFFPISLNEVPIAYLNNPNGRVFYTMKTYAIKQLNTYRRELFRQTATEYAQASSKVDKARALIRGGRRTFRLIGFLVLMNASSDEIKEFIRGDDTPLSDKVVNNIFKTVGFSRYQIDRARQSGVGSTAWEMMLPPAQLINDLGKDLVDVFSEDGLGSARTVRNIPVGGELYYWWFGRGRENIEKKQKKNSTRTGTARIGSSGSGKGAARIGKPRY